MCIHDFIELHAYKLSPEQALYFLTCDESSRLDLLLQRHQNGVEFIRQGDLVDLQFLHHLLEDVLLYFVFDDSHLEISFQFVSDFVVGVN